MKLAKTPLPCDTIYGELERFVENDIIDFDAIIGDEKLYEIDHYLLKLKAKQILEVRGFEVDAPRSEIFGCYDVIAKKGDYQINAECGVTPVARIWNNLSRFNEVWYIPYDWGSPLQVYIFKRGKNYWHYRDFIEGHTDIMVKCPKCNSPNFYESKICNQCGHNLERNLPKYCRTCGRKLPRKLVGYVPNMQSTL